jgi:hypothetical protein
MHIMTEEGHLENTIQESDGGDERFDVYLPVSSDVDGEGATHVARMRGHQAAFNEVLAGFVGTGSELSEPLRSPIDEAELEPLRSALEGLGGARVESIEPLEASSSS